MLIFFSTLLQDKHSIPIKTYQNGTKPQIIRLFSYHSMKNLSPGLKFYSHAVVFYCSTIHCIPLKGLLWHVLEIQTIFLKLFLPFCLQAHSKKSNKNFISNYYCLFQILSDLFLFEKQENNHKINST